MDSSTVGHSFPLHAPIRHTITILHLLSMSIAFLGCYPYAITQRLSRSSHNKHRMTVSLGCAVSLTFVGFVTGWHSPTPTTSLNSIILHTGLTLALFLLAVFDYFLEYVSGKFSNGQLLSPEQQLSTLSWLYSWVYHVPETAHVILKGITLCLGYFYLVLSVLVLTETCQSLDQYWLPLSIGFGFLLLGSGSFMHLVNIINVPRHASPEYFEAIWILLCGCLSLIWWDTSLLGLSWKAINLGLLWTTGGILSLAVNFQSWFPFMQKRNIVNSFIICLTGKGILSGYSDDSAYSAELQVTLGYLLMIGSMARFTQIIFRKSTADNLPRLYSRASGVSGGHCDDDGDGDDDTVGADKLDIGQQRATNYESTYRQLIGITSASSCKHQSVYASITLVCGLLYCFATIASGFFFMGTIVEWVEIMRYYINDPSTYVNVLLSITFLWTFYLLAMCSLYKSGTKSCPNYDYLDLATGEYCELPVYTKPSAPSTTYYNTSNNTHTAQTSKTSLTASPYDHMQHSSNFAPVSLSSLTSTKAQHHVSAPLSASTYNGSSAPPPSSSSSSTSSTSSSTSTPTSPQPMRPSQYRAKRRSLLIATGVQNNSNQDRAQRTLSASSFISVGGVLPDEVSIHGDFYSVSPIATTVDHQPKNNDTHQSSPTLQRRSWRSSSPSLRPANTHTETASLFHRDSWLRSSDDNNTSPSPTLYKTENGRRMDRH
ncbi:hypothetical protein BC941DRAFT_471088 [Chlamydoabsidia padenii]|nr:hypothetical protein BC941DRAFT_471088 [Chlamydoabsidia padenii]